MTQRILNAMESDSVNSITDTIEAEMVVNHIEDAYEYICLRNDLPPDRKLLQLEASNDVNKPTHMKVPDGARYVFDIRYDCRIDDTADETATYRKIKYLTPQQFLDVTDQRNDTATEVMTVTDFSSVPLKILNNAHPLYWTSFDDSYIVMDAYNSDLESTLQTSKSLAISNVEQSFSQTDTFKFNLPRVLRMYLYEEAKKACFYYMKGEADQLGIKRSREYKIRLNETSRAKGIPTKSGYGR